MTRRAQTMTCTRQRAIRPGFDDLEGRQLLSTVLPGDETSPSAPAIATFKGRNTSPRGRGRAAPDSGRPSSETAAAMIPTIESTHHH
jgi:hypothetical protein